jgi:hypothetical protein
MNPLVAKILSQLPVSPVDHIWFDFTDSTIENSYSDWLSNNRNFVLSDPIEKFPIPFDRMGIMIPLEMGGLTNGKFNDTVPYPVIVDRVQNKFSMKLFYHGFKTHVGEMIFFNDFSPDDYELKINPDYRKKFSNLPPNFWDRSNYTDIADKVLSCLAMISYGTPNTGAEIIGTKLTAKPGNEKRIRKGKGQLFEWNTVVIATKQEKERVDLGGTHASPKPHDRRGHQRRYKNGKVVYVKPTTINRHKIPEEGFIHHDYKVDGKKNWIQSVVSKIKNYLRQDHELKTMQR